MNNWACIRCVVATVLLTSAAATARPWLRRSARWCRRAATEATPLRPQGLAATHQVSLGVAPLAEQVVINACQAHARVVIRAGAPQLLNGDIEVEKNRPASIVANHALHP